MIGDPEKRYKTIKRTYILYSCCSLQDVAPSICLTSACPLNKYQSALYDHNISSMIDSDRKFKVTFTLFNLGFVLFQ